MYAKIGRMFYRDRLSISEIRRRTSLSRNTIKKWLKVKGGGEAVEPKYVRTKAVNKLTQFESTIQLAQQTDSHRPKRDRRTVLMLFNAIKQDGYRGSYSTLTRYIHGWRDVAAKVSSKSAFVPLHFQLGEAFQFDWSEESFMILNSSVERVRVCVFPASWQGATTT
jgi:transposase